MKFQNMGNSARDLAWKTHCPAPLRCSAFIILLFMVLLNLYETWSDLTCVPGPHNV